MTFELKYGIKLIANQIHFDYHLDMCFPDNNFLLGKIRIDINRYEI